jgi:integrase
MKRSELAWSFLDFRHTFGSQLAQKGVSLFKIAELMGNSPEIARRHYARLVPEQMHEEVMFARRSGKPSGIRSTAE